MQNLANFMEQMGDDIHEMAQNNREGLVNNIVGHLRGQEHNLANEQIRVAIQLLLAEGEEHQVVNQAQNNQQAQKQVANIVAEKKSTKEAIIRNNMVAAGFSAEEMKNVEKLLNKTGHAEKLVDDLMKMPSDAKRIEAVKKHIAVNNNVHAVTKHAINQHHHFLRNQMAGGSSWKE
ncbi:MAG: hypothetical protein RCG15_02545 [Candidatus Rickettsia vulgarisii]